MTRSHPSQRQLDTLHPSQVTELHDYPATDIFYHFPTTEGMYSLSYATTNQEEAFAEADQRADADTESRVVSFEYLTSPFYGVYTANTHTDYGSTNLEHISNTNTRTLVDAYTTIFESVMDHSDSDWHKPINIIRAAQTIDDVQWKQPAPDVAGELLSSLILAHPLPNTNHRSTIAFTGLYLSTLHDNFSLPTALKNEPQLTDWIDSFISTSKAILTTRRNTGLFRWLDDQEIETVVRKGGVLITLDDYDFSNQNLHESLTEEHLNECTAIIADILLATEIDDIFELQDDGKRTFSDRVAAADEMQAYSLGEAVAEFRD